ncbi:hypothetical protein [Aeromonas sp. s10]
MIILTYTEMRKLYSDNNNVKKIIDTGFNSTMKITNKKLINDKKVNGNSFLVNDDFDSNPICFSAFYTNGHFKVIRCIFVDESSRTHGLAKKMITEFQVNLKGSTEEFLQIGVEDTKDEGFELLDKIYKSMGFKRLDNPTAHPENKYFYDFFWSYKDFDVTREGGKVSTRFK